MKLKRGKSTIRGVTAVAIRSANVVRRGKDLWCEVRSPAVDRSTGKIIDAPTVLVLNRDYFSAWLYRSPDLQVVDNNDQGEPGRLAQTLLKIQAPADIFLNCFGTGGELFSEAYKSDSGSKWAASEELVDGRKLYILKWFTVRLADRPTAEYVIDPEKGFLVTRKTVFAKDGQVGADERYTAVPVGNGIFFPSKIEQHHYLRGAPRRTITTEVRGIRVNEAVDDSQFLISAMGFPISSRWCIRIRTVLLKGIFGRAVN